MSVKVNNVYIRENASSQYTRVNTVYANGEQVYGMRPYSTGQISIWYKGIDSLYYVYTISTDLWTEGLSLTFVGYLGQTNASSPYEPIGSLFNRGQVTMTSKSATLRIPVPALNINALYIGVVITSNRNGNYQGLKDIRRKYIYPTGSEYQDTDGHIHMQVGDAHSNVYLTNLPFGDGPIQASSDDVWLLWRKTGTDYKWGDFPRLLCDATNWNIHTSNITIRNRT